jgi:anti-sigma factor RsiW
MRDVDPRLERLIVRGLDGALSDDERLALDRELLRNLDARALHDELSRVDALARDALHAALRVDGGSVDPAVISTATPRFWKRAPSRSWWLVPGAIAASCLAVAVARITGPSAVHESDVPEQFIARHDPHAGNPIRSTMVPASGLRHGAADGAGILHNVGERPRIQRDTGREVIGVWGEDGNLYWLEIDRTRAFRRVPGGAGLGAARETI